MSWVSCSTESFVFWSFVFARVLCSCLSLSTHTLSSLSLSLSLSLSTHPHNGHHQTYHHRRLLPHPRWRQNHNGIKASVTCVQLVWDRGGAAQAWARVSAVQCTDSGVGEARECGTSGVLCVCTCVCVFVYFLFMMYDLHSFIRCHTFMFTHTFSHIAHTSLTYAHTLSSSSSKTHMHLSLIIIFISLIIYIHTHTQTNNNKQQHTHTHTHTAVLQSQL